VLLGARVAMMPTVASISRTARIAGGVSARTVASAVPPGEGHGAGRRAPLI
jgi:hypothetical protein